MKQYIRSPYQEGCGHQLAEPIVFPAPNGNLSIILTHEWEYAKDATTYLFHLVDSKGEIIENYTPLSSSRQVFWSNNSELVIINVGTDQEGYLIHDIPNLSFALIKNISRKWMNVKIESDRLIFEFPKDEFDRYNSSYQKPYGREINELPVVSYKYPDIEEFSIQDITFYPKEHLAELYELTKHEINISPIKNGYAPYLGELPQDTAKGYNGRDFEVYQLETFADYGDPQSIEWLNEIKSRYGSDYNKWTKVTDYIGFKKRKSY